MIAKVECGDLEGDFENPKVRNDGLEGGFEMTRRKYALETCN